MTKSRKLVIAPKLVRLNRNSAAVVADKSQSAAPNKTENQNTDGASNQSAAGSASNQSAAGSASNQSAGGASDQIAGGASDQGDASDQNKGGASASTSGDDSPLGRAMVFSYGELEKAANSFSHMIRQDRFTRVYLGKLRTAQGIFSTYVQIVSLKMEIVGDLQSDGLFLSEVIKLSLLRHSNLLNLIGFSVETPKPLLVYELMLLKCLDNSLFDLKPDSKPLNWETRLGIALGTARALHCLHKEAIAFGCVKTANILLDQNFFPRISYFRLGISGGMVIGNEHRGRVVSDIKAFGMLMLELITGRRHQEIIQELGETTIWSWLYSMLEDEDELYKVVDPQLGKKYSRESIYRAAVVAETCFQDEARLIRFNFSMGEEVENGITLALKAMAADNPDETRSVTRVEDPYSLQLKILRKRKKKIIDD